MGGGEYGEDSEGRDKLVSGVTAETLDDNCMDDEGNDNNGMDDGGEVEKVSPVESAKKCEMQPPRDCEMQPPRHGLHMLAELVVDSGSL